MIDIVRVLFYNKGRSESGRCMRRFCPIFCTKERFLWP